MIEATINLNVDDKKIKRSSEEGGNLFAKNMEKGMNGFLSKLGFGKISPPSSSVPKETSAIKSGVISGLAAGGVVGILGFIADTLKDIPIITSIFKMFRVIMNILLLPLVPILKPVLQLLGNFVSNFASSISPITSAIDKFVGVTIQPIVDFVSSFSNVMGKTTEAIWTNVNNLLSPLTTLKDMISDFSSKIWSAIESGLSFLSDLGKKIWNSISGFFSGISLGVPDITGLFSKMFSGTIDIVKFFKDLITGNKETSTISSPISGGATSTFSSNVPKVQSGAFQGMPVNSPYIPISITNNINTGVDLSKLQDILGSNSRSLQYDLRSRNVIN